MQCDISQVFKEAQKSIGATAPNPPVAAAAYDVQGHLLGVTVHKRPGLPHGEAALLIKAREEGWTGQIDTIYITLEPCNHFGRTPPCSHAMVESGVRKIRFGLFDPNPPAVGGAEYMRAHGIAVETGVESERAVMSLLPYLHKTKTGRPLVVVKQALRHDGTMIPDTGQKTFTNEEQLKLAHRMRKSCDAIVTGSGTVLADDPHFTVRHVQDHENKRRDLVILDRSNRVSNTYIGEADMRGFNSRTEGDLGKALQGDGMMTLVEAGPSVLSSFEMSNVWDVWVTLHEDGRVETRFNPKLTDYGTLDSTNADLLWAV